MQTPALHVPLVPSVTLVLLTAQHVPTAQSQRERSSPALNELFFFKLTRDAVVTERERVLFPWRWLTRRRCSCERARAFLVVLVTRVTEYERTLV